MKCKHDFMNDVKTILYSNLRIVECHGGDVIDGIDGASIKVAEYIESLQKAKTK